MTQWLIALKISKPLHDDDPDSRVNTSLLEGNWTLPFFLETSDKKESREWSGFVFASSVTAAQITKANSDNKPYYATFYLPIKSCNTEGEATEPVYLIARVELVELLDFQSDSSLSVNLTLEFSDNHLDKYYERIYIDLCKSDVIPLPNLGTDKVLRLSVEPADEAHVHGSTVTLNFYGSNLPDEPSFS